MKPIKMTDELEKQMLDSFFEEFKKEWDKFKENMNDTKFTFSKEFSVPAKEKVTILYSQAAYLKMQALVDFYDTEVAWYGLVEKMSEKLYYVYDVKVCKQYVNGAKVDTEDEDTLAFFNSLTDDEAEHMHFQAHSHVKMSTAASGVDLQNQADVIRNMGKSGFYIFQIWNKNLDINTYLYDMDENMFYDKKDVIVDVETDDGTLSDFIASTVDLVEKKKSYPYQANDYYPQKKKSKKDDTSYGYWDGNTYYGGYY